MSLIVQIPNGTDLEPLLTLKLLSHVLQQVPVRGIDEVYSTVFLADPEGIQR